MWKERGETHKQIILFGTWKGYIMTISYHMQNLMQIVHLSLFYIIFTEINVIPKYMLHVGTVKSMYLKLPTKKTNEQKNIYIYTYY